jgi:hypothetical protein
MPDDRQTLKRLTVGILRALETEPREVLEIRGASGLSHPVLAVGTDDVRKRLVIISRDIDGRTAALAQGDIQAAVGSTQVLVARYIPTLTDLQNETSPFRDETLGFMQRLQSLIACVMSPEFDTHLHSSVEQRLSTMGLYKTLESLKKTAKRIEGGCSPEELEDFNKTVERTNQTLSVQFDTLFERDRASIAEETLRKAATSVDVQMGICPLFCGDFSEEEIDGIGSSQDLAVAQNILRRHDVLQYFFPPADQLALGLIDRLSLSPSQILDQVITAPAVGHPLSEPELLPATASWTADDIIVQLQDRGLAVEGELGLELGPAGRTIRQTIRFKPREGLLSKLLNRFSIKLDLKDLFRH